MVCAWPRRSPSFPLPSRHAFQLSARGKLDHAVDFSVWMLVTATKSVDSRDLVDKGSLSFQNRNYRKRRWSHLLLSRKLLFTFHIHSGNAEVVRLTRRKTDFASTVMRAINLLSCNPSLITRKTFLDQRDELVIEAVARAVFGVETRFEFFPWRAVVLQ